MQKNVGSQSWSVFAFDRTTNVPKTGDAAAITAKIQLDDGSRTTSNDANPTEQEDGFYTFLLTTAETNGDKLNIYPESSTSNIQVIGVPSVIYTRPENFQELGVEADGDVTKVNLVANTTLVDTTTTNTDLAARTLPSADYVVVGDTLAGVTLVTTTTDVTNQVSADVTAVSGSATAADGLEAQYDGVTGLTGDLYPSTQAQVGNIASGTAATNTIATSATITTGTETLTYAVTTALDGVTHDVEDDGGNTSFYYDFSVGGNGVPVAVQWQGYANSNGDDYVFEALNWPSTWDQIGTKAGTSGSTIVTQQMDLTTGHVGTGANLGIVRIRITSADGTKFATDRLLCSFSVVSQSVGYANGSIWIDTLLGTSGSVAYVNGTADNPNDNLTEALTLSTNLGIRRFQIVSGSTIALISDASKMVGVGENWALELEGQLVTDATIIGATVTGNANAASTGAELLDCHFDTDGVGVGHTPSTSVRCGLRNEIRLLAAGSYVFKDCYSEVAGTGTPSLDFVSGIGASAVNFRDYSGGIEIKNMAAGDTMSLEGNGQIKINASCSAGTIAIRGNFTITDNVVGGFVAGGGVISDDARYDVGQIDGTITDNTLIADIPSTSEFEARTIAAADYLIASDTLARVTLVDTVTENTDMVTEPPTAVENREEMDSNSTQLALIVADTEDIQTQVGTAGAGLSDLGGMSTGMKAEVNAEVDLALNTDIGTPTADSIADYIQRMKYVMLNGYEIIWDECDIKG